MVNLSDEAIICVFSTDLCVTQLGSALTASSQVPGNHSIQSGSGGNRCNAIYVHRAAVCHLDYKTHSRKMVCAAWDWGPWRVWYPGCWSAGLGVLRGGRRGGHRVAAD